MPGEGRRRRRDDARGRAIELIALAFLAYSVGGWQACLGEQRCIHSNRQRAQYTEGCEAAQLRLLPWRSSSRRSPPAEGSDVPLAVDSSHRRSAHGRSPTGAQAIAALSPSGSLTITDFPDLLLTRQWLGVWHFFAASAPVFATHRMHCMHLPLSNPDGITNDSFQMTTRG